MNNLSNAVSKQALPIGTGRANGNSCEAIAIYNSLLMLKKKQFSEYLFAEILYDLEPYTIAGGVFGMTNSGVYKALRQVYGVKDMSMQESTNDNYVGFVKGFVDSLQDNQVDVFILTSFNDTTVIGAVSHQGVHTVMFFVRADGTYMEYNGSHNDYTTYDQYLQFLDNRPPIGITHVGRGTV